MMELLLDLGFVTFVLTLLIGGLAVWRIGQVVSWPALARTAWVTRSFTDSVAFIRFCAEEREFLDEKRPRRQRQVWRPVEFRTALDERPRLS